ncbi:hypothetical protein WOLCODRAFT_156594 [Wolfiporia cocos MD-104 SS10]|uniref:Retrotransposon gag domain-containing protein n=1 Tax=Wolfiporia cocos (strain MD-104) TaxID=742152 RepID=A0A2H3J2G4_WOLCO|nr:hypothetical protein WOLCODRAFT_156594 [Wolfiporia cocos MD-104 SS10]
MSSHTPTANPFLGIPLPLEHDTIAPHNLDPVDILAEAFAGLRAQSAPSIATNHITQATFGNVAAQSFAGPGMEPAPEQLDLAFTRTQQEWACMMPDLSHIDSPLAMQWAFPPNLMSHDFGLRFLREAQQVQADALQAGDVASLHSQAPAPLRSHVSQESQFQPIENWVRSVQIESPPRQSPRGARPLPTPPSWQTNPFLPGYMPPVLPSPALSAAVRTPPVPVPPLVAPQNAHVNTWGAARLQGTRASMWRPEKPATSQWDAYSTLLVPAPDPRYKPKVREPGDFSGDGFKDWYMWLKLYINNNAPLLYTDSKKVGAAISMIRSPKVDAWVTAFTREHYMGGQWQISWPQFVWELHQKFDDPDLDKKAVVAAEKLTMQAGKGKEHFQELERLLNDAKYDWENQVVHHWVTAAIPKEIYPSVHQAFITATINDKSQQGYNVQIPEDYKSWKQAILCTDNTMCHLRDEEKLRNHDWKDKVSDKGKEHAQQERPKTEPTDE